MANSEDQSYLVEDTSVRRNLRTNLLLFWRNTFEDLHRMLRMADGIEFTLMMHACEEISSVSRPSGVPIKLHYENAFNAQLIAIDIIDDFCASYLCFLNGFTKQTHQILRNAIELVIQLYYMDHLRGKGNIIGDNWAAGNRGIEWIRDKLHAIEDDPILNQHGLVARLRKVYGLLCMSTHSHKERMSALQMPRIVSPFDQTSFEPTEILYTRALFLSVMDMAFRMIKQHYENSLNSDLSVVMTRGLADIMHFLERYRRVIDLFHKGYLIHRENIAVASELQILFSVKLNGELEYPRCKIKLNHEQNKRLKALINKRLLQDRV